MDLRKNRWLVAGLAAIVVGFVLLARFESLSLAPILLVGGYCVLIPLHLWTRYRAGVGE